jgi:hypothetical protein
VPEGHEIVLPVAREVHVGAADAAGVHLDQHLSRSQRRNRNLADVDLESTLREYSFHA